jgi:hypothetical protein
MSLSGDASNGRVPYRRSELLLAISRRGLLLRRRVRDEATEGHTIVGASSAREVAGRAGSTEGIAGGACSYIKGSCRTEKPMWLLTPVF